MGLVKIVSAETAKLCLLCVDRLQLYKH